MKTGRYSLFAALVFGISLIMGGIVNPTVASAHAIVAQGAHAKTVADSQGHLHGVFEAYEPGAKVPDIFYSNSTDGGKHWSPRLNVSHTPGVSSDPAIAVDDSGAIDVVWADTSNGDKNPDIFYSRSTDGGKHWSPYVNISHTPGISSNPVIGVDHSGALSVAWADTSDGEKNPDIFFSHSTDGGKTWTPYVNVSHTPGVSLDPAIVVDQSGALSLVWTDTSASEKNPDIFFSHSIDGGKTWTPYVNVSRTPGVSSHAAIAADNSGALSIVWMDTSEGVKNPDTSSRVFTQKGWTTVVTEGAANSDIFFARSIDGGKTWSKYVNISHTPGVSSTPAIVAEKNGHLSVVWSDTTYNASAPDIFLSRSKDAGKTWSPYANVTRTPGVSQFPSVSVAGQKLVITWQETQQDNSASVMATGRRR